MCSNYRPATADQLQQHFFVAPPDTDFKPESYPGYMAPFIRTPRADAGEGDRACALGMFGMVPHWAEIKLARQTYNARTETAATKPSYRHAYKHGQFCIIPISSFYEPCYESGKAVRFEIAAANGEPLGVAGLWEIRPPAGDNPLPLLSFTMLTINADDHPLMRRFHKPDDEKRMPVILPVDRYDDWLHCSNADASRFFTQYQDDRLVTQPMPKSPGRTEEPTV